MSQHEAICPGATSFHALLGDLNDSASVLMEAFIQGGDGNDHLTLCPACSGGLDGEAGSDILRGGNERSLLDGGTGSDTLRGGAACDLIYGEKGADFIAGRASGDNIYGGRGRDELRGNRGNNPLFARDAVRDLVRGGKDFDGARVGPFDVLRSIERLLF